MFHPHAKNSYHEYIVKNSIHFLRKDMNNLQGIENVHNGKTGHIHIHHGGWTNSMDHWNFSKNH